MFIARLSYTISLLNYTTTLNSSILISIMQNSIPVHPIKLLQVGPHFNRHCSRHVPSRPVVLRHEIIWQKSFVFGLLHFVTHEPCTLSTRKHAENRAELVRNNGFTYIIIPFLSISRMEHASDRQFVRYIVGYCSRR